MDSILDVEEIIQESTSTFTSKSSSQAEEAEKKGSLVIIYFTANNCPPCVMIGPIYQDLAELDDFNEKGVQFLKVNVNDHPDIATKFNVDGWPTFLFIKDGEVINDIVGGNAAKNGLYDDVMKYA